MYDKGNGFCEGVINGSIEVEWDLVMENFVWVWYDSVREQTRNTVNDILTKYINRKITDGLILYSRYFRL